MRCTLVAMLLSLCAAAVVNSAPPPAPKLEAGRIVDGIACESDPAMTYAYYLPSIYDPSKAWPILYVFDPRARGTFAAELFRAAAEEHGWIIVSSNNTRSDAPLQPNLRAVNAMWPDPPRHFSVDPRRIYTAGFSGGAVLAWAVAQSTGKVAGVISSGGRVNQLSDTDHVTWAWFATAGDRDFNFGPTREIEARLAATNGVRRLEIFPGGHRWGPPELLRRGIIWLELEAMKRGSRPRNDEFIARQYESELTLVRAETDILRRVRGLESIARTFTGLRPVADVAAEAQSLRATPETTRALRDEKRADELEESHRRRMTRLINTAIRSEEPVFSSALAHEMQISTLKRLAKEDSYAGAAAGRVLSFMAAAIEEEITPAAGNGTKQTALAAVARMIRE